VSLPPQQKLKHLKTKRYGRADIKKVLIGTGSHLAGKRKVTVSEAEEFAKQQGIKYFEVSVKNNLNIDECFIYLVDAILDSLPSPNYTDPQPQGSSEQKCLVM